MIETCTDYTALDFSSTLTYEAETNDISGAVAVNGMDGTMNAKFYGDDDHIIKGVGGTFTMAQGNDKTYEGRFGVISTHRTASLNTNYRGFMVAGFETPDDDIPEGVMGEMVEFSGNGYGTYRSSSSYYNTSFNVTANVDFANYMVELETSNTSYYRNFLNFTTILSYDAGKNILSGDVEASGMSGTAEARFLWHRR